MLTRPETARELRVSLATLDRLVGRGELPVVRVGGRTLVRAADLRRFIAERVVRSEGTPR